MDAAAERPVGEGAEGDREGGGPAQNLGPPRRGKVQPVGLGLPLHHGCREAGPGRGWGRSTERGFRVGAPRAERKGRGDEARD